MLDIAISRTPDPIYITAAGANETLAASTAGQHIDLDGALTSRLAFISMRFQQALENMAAAGIKEQKAVNARIKALSEVLNVLQKLELGGYSPADLNKALDLPAIPLDARNAMVDINEQQAETERSTAKQAADGVEYQRCHNIAAESYRKGGIYKQRYDGIVSVMDLTGMTALENGMIRFWGLRKTDGAVVYVDFQVSKGTWAWDNNGVADVQNVYRDKQIALAAADTAYKNATSNGFTLRAALYGLNIYKKDEKLPQSKDELKIATTKISDMVSSLQAAQATLTSDVSGINNNSQQQLTKISEMLTGYFSTIQRLIESMH
ncbi:hypothetical protein D9O50_04620 [Oxalobacteraceae bacterium CAVE-383]|nr:hypothetical protein D9O50_04620 [Oxalobacteraceae bacterium CAVE-383]